MGHRPSAEASASKAAADADGLVSEGAASG